MYSPIPLHVETTSTGIEHMHANVSQVMPSAQVRAKAALKARCVLAITARVPNHVRSGSSESVGRYRDLCCVCGQFVRSGTGFEKAVFAVGQLESLQAQEAGGAPLAGRPAVCAAPGFDTPPSNTGVNKTDGCTAVSGWPARRPRRFVTFEREQLLTARKNFGGHLKAQA